MTYQVCIFDEREDLIGAQVTQFDDDAHAKERTHRFLKRWAYEVWKDGALVASHLPEGWTIERRRRGRPHALR